MRACCKSISSFGYDAREELYAAAMAADEKIDLHDQHLVLIFEDSSVLELIPFRSSVGFDWRFAKYSMSLGLLESISTSFAYLVHVQTAILAVSGAHRYKQHYHITRKVQLFHGLIARTLPELIDLSSIIAKHVQPGLEDLIPSRYYSTSSLQVARM
ncbi:unnamed protein product [Microthlaspi erraticum]|uniref:Uncharacterized protein n=1 Tax=Microthlaspi erraticum TaxID=1685480 RepID=A0A6D2L8P1_9BRAS|nr:unnamed protein product [Microthlaspi erraticum]